MKWGRIRMRSKKAIGQSVCVILAVSMIGMGTAPSIPKAFADSPNVAAAAAAESNGTNTLSQLEIMKSDGTSLDDENLAAGTFQYSATVENSVQYINLLVKSADENAVIKVNGQQVINNNSAQIALNTGDNSIEITVDDGVNPANTYTLTVTRNKSSNNLLQGIQLSKGVLSPAFNPATTSYNVALTNDVNAITVTPVSNDKTETMTVNGTKVADNGISVNTPVGVTKISIVVTAENGDAKTYILEVAREAGKVQTPPSAGKGSKGSKPSKPGSYTGSKTGAKLGAKSGSTKFGSKGMASFNKNGAVKTGSGASWGQGGAAVQKPSTATLSSLSVSSGTWNKTFAKDTYTYHIALGSKVTEVTLEEETAYSGASVTINGSTSNAIEIGNQSKTIIPIVVTNGSDRKTYVLVFDKTIPQTSTTTAASASTDNSADIQTTTSNLYNSAPYTQGNRNNQNNAASASWWSQLINGIRSFFSNL